MFRETMKKYNQIFILFLVLIIIFFAINNIMQVKDFFFKVLNVLSPFLFGLFFALLLYVPSKKLERFLQKNKFLKKSSRLLSIILIYIAAFTIITILLRFIFPVFYDNMKILLSNVPTFYNNALEYLNNIPEDSILSGIDFGFIQSGITLENIQNNLNIDTVLLSVKSVFGVASTFVSVIVGIILSVYVLYNRESILSFFQRFLRAFFSPKTEKTFSKYLEKGSTIFSSFINGQLLDSLIIGVLACITLSIMRVEYAVSFGMLIGIANLIPFFGAIIAVGVTVLITIFTGGFWQAFWVLIVVLILQQIDANIINPKILSQNLKLSPLLVILAVTVGGGLFGVLGMFFGVPVIALIKVMVMDYIEHKEQS